MHTNDWQDFFDHYAPLYMGESFVTATLAEADFLVEQLHLQPGMRVLDVGCGSGRHAVELARREYRVTGVDISRGMLAEAHKAAAAAGVAVEWVHSPAQAYAAVQPFDAVYSVCEGSLSLLGAQDAYDRDLSILTVLFAALKPGGRALITVLNAMRYFRMYHQEDIHAGRFDPLQSVENGFMEVDTPQGRRRIPTRERGYVPTELRLMLEQTGFVVDGIYGGTAGDWGIRPPQLDEMELMALMSKPRAD